MLFDRQSASQLAAIGQPTSDVQNANLSDSRLVILVVVGGLGSDHIRPQSRVPALPPWGVTYMTKARQVTHGVLQPVIYHWHYLQGTFAVLYICHLITYSCTKCREMLSRLFSVQTNVCISFHHQSDVLLNQGTTFMELLL